MLKNKIVFVILFALLAAGFVVYKMYNKPHANLNEAKADFVVNTTQLLAEFEADENAANQKYLNKIIELSAELSEVQKVEGKTIWILSTGDPLANIQCEMDPRFIKENEAGPATGTKVTVQGICSGKLMDIVLSQVVVKTKQQE